MKHAIRIKDRQTGKTETIWIEAKQKMRHMLLL